jgi:putative CocE/NonD family hydrolase
MRMTFVRALLRSMVLLCVCCVANAAADDSRVSKPFEYRGYSSATFSEQKRVATFIPMRDGTKLAATIFMPVADRTTRVPVILWYLPGHRESIDPRTGAMRPYGSPEQIKFFTSHGYAWALVEMRGSGASFGTRQDRSPQIGLDGKEVVEWLATQSWSDGSVGMVGASYQGFSQYATAAHRPKGLKAIFPEIAGFDEYSIMFYPGGIQSIAMSDFATANIAMDDQNVYRARSAGGAVADRGAAFDVLPSAPVIDEDGDGELADEIPVDKNNNGTFLDDGEPTYADGKAREHIYFNATRQHLDNVNLTAALVAQAPFRDSPLGPSKITYAELGPADRLSGLAGSNIAVYNRAGWFDYHARCAAQWFASLDGKTPSRLMFAPTGHSGFAGGRSSGGPYWKMFGLTLTDADLNNEKLRFFDRYLKGVDNGIDREPPVYIYVMGKGWRAEQEWPLQRARSTKLYFNAERSLAEQSEPAGRDPFTVDFSADSRSNGANRWNFRIASSSTPLGASQGGRIAYETAPLQAEMEVTGHPLVQLAVASQARDGDFFVFLEDVAPDGTALRVTDGQLRASFEAVQSENAIAHGKAFDVKPALPWHGFRQRDRNLNVFANGRVAKLKIDLMPTSWVFQKGHRIRVAINGADFPTFQLNPTLVPNNDPKSVSSPPTYDIHRGAQMSFVELPVIGE